MYENYLRTRHVDEFEEKKMHLKVFEKQQKCLEIGLLHHFLSLQRKTFLNSIFIQFQA